MVIEKISGVVARSIDYSNSSKIITVISKEHKNIGILAKGAKQLKSKFRVSTIPYIYADFNIYYKPNGLSTLISVDPIDYLSHFRKDIIAYSYATYITEIMLQVIKEDFNESIYKLYVDSMQKLNEEFNPKIITSIFELQILDFLGIKPSLEACVRCGNPSIINFSVEDGGSLCESCNDIKGQISEKALKLLSILSYVDISKISKLDIKENIINELNNYIDLYFEKYSGLFLKSKKILQSLTKPT